MGSPQHPGCPQSPSDVSAQSVFTLGKKKLPVSEKKKRFKKDCKWTPETP